MWLDGHSSVHCHCLQVPGLVMPTLLQGHNISGGLVAGGVAG